MSVFCAAALEYAAKGWLVFPCQPKSKIPATAHGFKDATGDPAQIRAWWDEEPAYNVAIATGEGSGIFVLDVDHKAGRTIEEALEMLPEIPEAPTVWTGGGGRQYFFRFPAGSGLSISGGRLGLGVDTRGNGGYVVAPPSIHPHGTAYEWKDSDGVELPDCPPWIIERLARQRSGAKQLAAAKITGGRHDALMTAAALMRSSGFAPPEIEAALHKMKDRLDLSDGRVITDKEIADIAQWCGDKGVGDVNIESVLHGQSVSKAMANRTGGALTELLAEPGIADPGHLPARFLEVPGIVSEWTAYINATSHRRQPELALAAVLTACGALIGRRLQSVTGGRANMYTIGLCETGGGKERARQGVKEVLLACGADALIGPEDFASESGLVSSLVTAPVQLFQVDEIGKLLAAIANPRAGSHLVGIVSALLKLYSSANTVYKGKAYADAAKNPVINQPHVCLYGTAVPDQAWQALGASSVEDGLLARLWVFTATDQKPPRQRFAGNYEKPTALINRLAAWVKDAPRGLSDVNPCPTIVRRDEAAERLLANLEDECDALELRMKDSPLRKLWTRTAQKADQLSLIYAWSRDPAKVVVDQDAAKWAAELATYLTESMIWHASRHLAGSSVEADLQSVLRYVESGGVEGKTRKEVCRRFQRLGKRGLDEVFTLLEVGEQVVERTDEREGAGVRARRFYSTRFAPMLGGD